MSTNHPPYWAFVILGLWAGLLACGLALALIYIPKVVLVAVLGVVGLLLFIFVYALISEVTEEAWSAAREWWKKKRSQSKI